MKKNERRDGAGLCKPCNRSLSRNKYRHFQATEKFLDLIVKDGMKAIL